MIESDSEPETPPMELENPKTPEPLDNTTPKKRTFGLAGKETASAQTRSKAARQKHQPRERVRARLSIITAHMMDTEVDRAIEDAKCTDQELFIRDENGRVHIDNIPNSKLIKEDNLENCELDLAKNLSSSTEIETDLKNEEEKTVRRPIRLTKTNPIVT